MSCEGAVSIGGNQGAVSSSGSTIPPSIPVTENGQETANQQQRPETLLNRLQNLFTNIYNIVNGKMGSSYEDVTFWMSD